MLDDNVYNNMVKIAFAEPFNKIIENTGISSSLIYNNIKNSEFKLIYKIDNGSYEDIFETKIVDPYLVVAECIKNAISIAGLLLIQQIESNFIYPKIVGRSVGLHPLFVLLSVSAAGYFGGLVWMILAVPIAGIIKVLITNWAYKQ